MVRNRSTCHSSQISLSGQGATVKILLREKKFFKSLNFKIILKDFELDPSLRHNMAKETGDRIERVRLEMQWDKAKLALLHEKLKVSNFDDFFIFIFLSRESD